MKKTKITAVALVLSFSILLGCADKEAESKAYSALMSTLSALRYGNYDPTRFDEISLKELTENGFMAPSHYPYAARNIKDGTWEIIQVSDSVIQILIKDSENLCEFPYAIDSFAMLGVSTCDYNYSTLVLTISRSHKDGMEND